MHIVLLSSCLFAGGLAHAANDLPGGGIDPQALDRHVQVLASPAFEGRAPASAGEQRTVDYLVEQFSAAGLQPGGEDGRWVQEVPLVRVSTRQTPTARLHLGDNVRELVNGQDITLQSLQPQDQITLDQAPLVFIGYGIDAPERGWDDYKQQDLRGKVAIVLINDADFHAGQPGAFDGRAVTYYGRWTYKYEEAARQGAAGVLIVHETRPASYGWTTVANSWSVPQFDIVRQNPSAERVPMEAWIQRDVAVEMFRQAGLDFEQEKIKARSRDFQPVELKGATIDAKFDVKTDQITTHNVLAKLEGTTHPNETILYTGHWDHIGMGEPDANGDRIFNGAVDNASGTAGLLELARQWAKGPKPERTIVMISFTGEESGLLGSEFYAANPLYPLETTVAGFNLDASSVLGRMSKLGVTGYGQSELDERVIALAAAQGRGFEGDAGAGAGIYFRSDHFPLAKRGVPMGYLSSTGDYVDEPIAPRLAAAADYRANRYHQAADEWEPTWDYRGMIQDLEVVFDAGQALANSRDWPQWKAGSEFGPARTVSDAQRK